MKAKKLALVSSAFVLLGAFVLGGYTAGMNVSAEGAATSETATTDYKAFKIRGGSAGSITAADNSLTYTGAWNGNFAVTDQFDTRSGNYSLKTRVCNTNWAISTDSGTGFCIYYNDTNYITFFLKWCSNNTTASFAEGIMLNNVGTNLRSYQYAVLPSGEFTTPAVDLVEAWGDAAWTVNGSTTNLFRSSNILVNKGFDMTLHVERSVYKNRAVDLIQLQVDGFASDGTTPLSAYSPKYAVDAFTNPSGNGTSALIDRKPQIGFQNWNMSNTTYSAIVFTDKNTEKVNAKITRVGAAVPTTATVDAENDTLTYNNPHFVSGFMMTDLATTATESIDIQATVSGTKGNVADTQLGFVYYFDDNNYAAIYAKWDGTTSTIGSVVAYFKVNGENAGASAARDPWDNSKYEASTDGFFTYFTDFSGWITDSPEPIYTDETLNKIRSQSALTISSGFTFGLQRTRVTFLSRVVDAFQFRVSAKGTDDIYHNWYSPTFCVDAYTCPNGGEVSALANKAPQIGFYSFQADEITISNIKYNGKKAEVSYSGKEEARIFTNTYMHLSDVPTTDGTAGTACKGDNGYYALAKTGWSNLSTDGRSAFLNEDEFSGAKARLIAWASANGEAFDSANNLSAKSSNLLKSSFSSSSENAMIAIVTIITLAASLSAAFIFIRKKKSSER